MPKFTLDELITIGKDMSSSDDFPKDSALAEVYSEESIKKRFEEYGGIIRNVLPHNLDQVDLMKHDKESAYNNADGKKLTRNHFHGFHTLNFEICEHLAQFHVTATGENAFLYKGVEQSFVDFDRIRELIFK